MARSVNDLIGTAVGAPINQAKITGRCHRSLVAGTKRDRLCCIEPSDATAAAALAVGGGDEATTGDAGATTKAADSVAQGGAGPCTRYCTTHHSGRANTNPRRRRTSRDIDRVYTLEARSISHYRTIAGPQFTLPNR